MSLDDRGPAPWREGIRQYEDTGSWDEVDAEGRFDPDGLQELHTTSLVHGSPRGDLYQAQLRRYRKPRTTPRPDVSFPVFEDPAPDWMWMLARDILEHTGFEPDHGDSLLLQALTWCEAGDPVARSARLRDNPTVPSRGRVLDEAYIATMRRFLSEAWKHSEYLGRKGSR